MAYGGGGGSEMRDPWRRRCPQKHTTVKIRSEDYFCESCDCYYSGRPYDIKTDDLPVDEDPSRYPDRPNARARGEISPLGVVALLTVVYALCVLAIAVGVML